MTTAGDAGAPAMLTVARRFAAPVERVYAAWTDPAQLQRWHCPVGMSVALAEADVRVGGRYRIRMKAADKEVYHTATGEYREVEPLRRLSYTWRWEERQDFAETLVTVSFMQYGGETEVLLVHERFVSRAESEDHTKGWTSLLENLACRFGA